MIISASRRMDIPSSHYDWFLNRLKEKYVITQNPISKNNFYKIPLNKDIVDIIVFWSKNPNIDFLKQIDNLGYNFYIHFTITPYDTAYNKVYEKEKSKEKEYDKTIIEKNIPSKNILIEKFIDISKLFGKDKIVWRYDPIILNNEFNIDYHT